VAGPLLEHVAEPPDGVDERFRGDGLQLAPHVPDIDIRVVRQRIVLAAPHVLRELVAGDDGFRAAQQELEQPVLGRGERQWRVMDGRGVGDRVQRDGPVPQHVRHLPRASPPPERAEPRHQLLEREGLGQVVVGAAVEPRHAIR
jgi:hypothetical protein